MVQEGLISKISNSIKDSQKKPALIPFIVSGYPDIEITKNLLLKFQESGVAAIELGVPFSDPLADGAVIQKASKEALAAGINLDKIFDMLDEMGEKIKTPIILFSYFNPILAYGVENFIQKASKLNVAGLIVPDLPIEESEAISSLCIKENIDFIKLIAPTSDKSRISKISKGSTGFIYLVSSTGVTGVREGFSDILSEITADIKNTTDIPVAVGFGVSKPEHIKELKKLGADAVIVGSAIVKLMEQYKEDKSLLISKVELYLNSLYR